MGPEGVETMVVEIEPWAEFNMDITPMTAVRPSPAFIWL